jgi:ABC-type glycerol-3-phosphate transport system substrate-binding protein
MKKMLIGALALILVGAVLGGCSTDTTTPETANPEGDTVSKAELDRAVDEAVADAKAEFNAEATDSGGDGEGEAKVNRVIEDAEQGQSDDKATVPDVVGMDHQLAQDTMQARGFYMLDEVDCTGQDRMMLWDRNWTVEEQKPSAGTKASTDATITLCSVKDGE